MKVSKKVIDAAVNILRSKGFVVATPDSVSKDLWLIRYADDDGHWHYCTRLKRYNGRGTIWPNGAAIAYINTGKLEWKPINKK